MHPEVLREGAHHLVTFGEAQEPMVDEHAHQLIADGAMQEGGDHRGVDPARQAEQHLALANLRAHALDGILDDVADTPQRVAPADLAHEALEQPRALRGVGDFRVELHAVEAPALVAHRRERDVGGGGGGREPSRQRGHAIAVAHPHVEHCLAGRIAAVREVIEQARGAGHGHFRVTELALGGRRDPAAELLRHGLHAVADAEYRHAELVHRRRRPRRVLVGHRLRSPERITPRGRKARSSASLTSEGGSRSKHPVHARAAR